MSDDDATAERRARARPNMIRTNMRNLLDSAIVACNRKNSRATTTTTIENMKPAKKKPATDNKKPATKKQENFLNNPLSMKHWCPPSDLLLEPEGGDASDVDVSLAQALQEEEYRNEAQALQEEEYRNEARVESKGESGASLKEPPRGVGPAVSNPTLSSNISLNDIYKLGAKGCDITQYCGPSRRIPARKNANKKPAATDVIDLQDSDDGSTNKKSAARSTNKKPATKEVIDLFSDTTSPENDVDFDAFINGVQESVCDPDKVYVVLNDIPSKKRSDFSEPIVLKYKDFQDGVSKQEVKEYLEYIKSQKYIDGKKFIEWVDLKKVLLKNYHQRCDRFSGKEKLLLRIHFFFDALKFTLKDVIVSEQLYMYWNAVNHPCRFPLVPILAAILGAEIDVNQKVEERMRDQINLLVRQLSLGKQDDKQGNLSYVNMNYQMFLHKNIHDSKPGQIYQVFSNLRENNHGEEMVDDFKELVNAIAILLEIDQNDEEERKHFVKLTELMKWCLEMSEFLGRPLTLQRTLFHAFAHGVDFNLKITGAENWKKIMKKADQSGQKPKPKKKKKQTAFIKKSFKNSMKFFQGVGNKLGGNRATETHVSARANVNANMNESHGMIQQPQPSTENDEEVDLVNRIFDACVITDNENIAMELLENVDKMRSMVDNNNNNNPTRQQKFADTWMKHTLLNSSKLRKMKIKCVLYDKQWDDTFRELCRFQEEHGHTRVGYIDNKSLYKWCDDQRGCMSENKKQKRRNVMTPKRFISLCSIDFVWDTWYDTYDKLMKYKKSHGRLPRRKDDRNSYGWIRRFSGLQSSKRHQLDSLSYQQLQHFNELLKGDPNYYSGLENVQAELKKKFGNSLARK